MSMTTQSKGDRGIALWNSGGFMTRLEGGVAKGLKTGVVGIVYLMRFRISLSTRGRPPRQGGGHHGFPLFSGGQNTPWLCQVGQADGKKRAVVAGRPRPILNSRAQLQ